MVIPIVIRVFETNPKGLGKGAERVGNWRRNRDHPNYSIVEICQNIERSPGDLIRPTVPQTSVKNYEGVKTRKEYMGL